MDRGFIYAIAHVRGGGEKGDAWHDAGRLANKANTFTDFLAVAEHLVRERLTSPGRIVASGASAGGTLVGAAVNMRPDLFGAVYAEVPFVDCLNTLLDRSAPLTEASFSEFGNPIDSRTDFLNIQSYSPYENVRAQAYPPMLISQSLNDCARALLGGRQVGGKASPPEDRRQRGRPLRHDARRPQRRVGPIRQPGGLRQGLRFCAGDAGRA